MRIAFDLDDTLIPGMVPFPTEPPVWGALGRWLAREPLRLGTRELLRALVRHGHEVWIYTTSFRGPWETKLRFHLHGAPIVRAVNQSTHQRRMAQLGAAYKTCSKYPPAFGIDLLIDDSEGVLIESRRHGFEMLLVRPDDEDWAAKVRRAAGLR